MAELVDIDLDALAPALKRVKLGGKTYKLPGDMPLGLFLRIQGYEKRVDSGANESELLGELAQELLSLFQVHQPTLKALPEIGVLSLLGSLGAIYGGAVGEPPSPTRATPAKKKTPSKSTPARRPATSR